MSKKRIAGLTLLLIAIVLVVVWAFVSTGLPLTDEALARDTAQRYLNAMCSHQFDPIPDLVWNGGKYPRETILKSVASFVLSSSLYNDCVRMQVDPGATTELHYGSGQPVGVDRTFSVGFWTTRVGLTNYFLPVVKTADRNFLVVADFLDLAPYVSPASTTSPVLNKSGQDIGGIDTLPASVSHCIPTPGVVCIQIPITLHVKDYVAWAGYSANLRVANKPASAFDVSRLPDEVNRLGALPVESHGNMTGIITGYFWFELGQADLGGDAALLFTAWSTDGDMPIHPSVVKISFQPIPNEKRWPTELDIFPQKAKYVPEMSERGTGDKLLHHKEVFSVVISTQDLRPSTTFPIHCDQFRLFLSNERMVRGTCTSLGGGDELPPDHEILETLVFAYDDAANPARLEYWVQNGQGITVKALWPS